ncbi:MAG: hypothetical protein EBS53_16030 [Bacteroidetes bacterium]|nr:hypothetical protein [Bacteroidota bacterium]
MTTYQLTMDGTHAIEFNDGVATTNLRNVLTDDVYLYWLSQGNTPEPEVKPEVEPEEPKKKSK